MLLEQKFIPCGLALGLGSGRGLRDGEETVGRQKTGEEMAVIRS